MRQISRSLSVSSAGPSGEAFDLGQGGFEVLLLRDEVQDLGGEILADLGREEPSSTSSLADLLELVDGAEDGGRFFPEPRRLEEAVEDAAVVDR